MTTDCSQPEKVNYWTHQLIKEDLKACWETNPELQELLFRFNSMVSIKTKSAFCKTEGVLAFLAEEMGGGCAGPPPEEDGGVPDVRVRQSSGAQLHASLLSSLLHSAPNRINSRNRCIVRISPNIGPGSSMIAVLYSG